MNDVSFHCTLCTLPWCKYLISTRNGTKPLSTTITRWWLLPLSIGPCPLLLCKRCTRKGNKATGLRPSLDFLFSFSFIYFFPDLYPIKQVWSMEPRYLTTVGWQVLCGFRIDSKHDAWKAFHSLKKIILLASFCIKVVNKDLVWPVNSLQASPIGVVVIPEIVIPKRFFDWFAISRPK